MPALWLAEVPAWFDESVRLGPPGEVAAPTMRAGGLVERAARRAEYERATAPITPDARA